MVVPTGSQALAAELISASWTPEAYAGIGVAVATFSLAVVAFWQMWQGRHGRCGGELAPDVCKHDVIVSNLRSPSGLPAETCAEAVFGAFEAHELEAEAVSTMPIALPKCLGDSSGGVDPPVPMT